MIRNDQQLSVTEAAKIEFISLLSSAKGNDIDAYRQVIKDLDVEIDEYKAIRAGYHRIFRIDSFDDIGIAISKCRRAKGWTQERLASELGLKKQQLQRYEAGDFEKAALWRVAEIVDMLGYELQGVLRPAIEEAGGRPLIEELSHANQFSTPLNFEPDVVSGSNVKVPSASKASL
jgi:transcriptional regulator with XRE-family HTH domain